MTSDETQLQAAPKSGEEEKENKKTVEQIFKDYCEANPGAVECKEFDV